MAKSKARYLAEILGSDGKVSKSKSSGFTNILVSDLPNNITNAKLQNSTITVAGDAVSLGGSVAIDTSEISEHSSYKFFTEARSRGSISAALGGGHGAVAYNSGTGALTVTGVSTEAIQDVVGAMFSGNTESGITVTYDDNDGTIDLSVAALNTGNVSEGSNLYHTTARARAAISATGSLSYNSTTGVISFTMPAQNTSNITEGSNLYYTNARAISAVTGSDLDMSGRKVLFGNMYSSEGSLPSASTYHGMFAHVHGTGKGYFAHAGSWIKLLDESSSTTANLTEGLNLYYTNARADARIVNAGSANWNTAYGWGNHASEGYTTTDTTYSVQDGELSQNNFTNADHSKLDGIAASANNYVLPFTNNSANWNTAYGWGNHASGGYAPAASPTLTGAPLAPTAAANTNTTQIATTAYVQTEITDLIAGAPGTLDTLNELAAAINDDSNYNSTLTTALATKVNKTSNQALSTAANAMTISGHTITLARGDSTTDTVTVPDNNTTYSVGDGGLTTKNFTAALKNKLDGIAASATNTSAPHYTSAIAVGDGGLTTKNFTAALKTKLDGIAASANNYTIPSTVAYNTANFNNTQRIRFSANETNNWDTIATSTGSQGCLEVYNQSSGNDAFMTFHTGSDYALYFGLDADSNKLAVGGWSMGAVKHAIYHEGNIPSLATLGYTGATNANYSTNNFKKRYKKKW